MFSGLQLHIKALDAIIPNSFIFILDGTDRSFVYSSSDCHVGKQEILDLDRIQGIENLMSDKTFYSVENEKHAYMIKKFSNHMFMGFFARKDKFSPNRISSAKEFFEKMA